jgi:hypothetical protein
MLGGRYGKKQKTQPEKIQQKILQQKRKIEAKVL